MSIRPAGPASGRPATRHFLNLDGARTLPTNSLLLVEQAVADLVAAQAMGVVHGSAGLGKTYAVEQALARLSPGEAVGVCWAAFPSRPTMRLVASTLLEELTGVGAGRRNRFRLSDQLIDELAGAERAVVVDEAQRLNTECIEYLRHLHDHPLTRFALLLVGGDGTWQVLSREPMLRSRIYRRVAVTPLAAEQVCQLIPSFHPIYDGVDRELLLFIDDHFGHGNLRNWASFTHTAAGLCQRHDLAQVTETVARNAFALHGGAVTNTRRGAGPL